MTIATPTGCFERAGIPTTIIYRSIVVVHGTIRLEAKHKVGFPSDFVAKSFKI
jgi:hypothetical protein